MGCFLPTCGLVSSQQSTQPVQQGATYGRVMKADVHYGCAPPVAAKRSQTLSAARAAHPERFTTTRGH